MSRASAKAAKIQPQKYDNLPGSPVVFTTPTEIVEYAKRQRDLTLADEQFLEECFAKMSMRSFAHKGFYLACKNLSVGPAFEGLEGYRQIVDGLKTFQDREGIPYQTLAVGLLKEYHFNVIVDSSETYNSYGEQGKQTAWAMGVLSEHIDKKALLSSAEPYVALNTAITAESLGWPDLREDVERTLLEHAKAPRLLWYADRHPEVFGTFVARAFEKMNVSEAAGIYRGDSGSMHGLSIHMDKFKPGFIAFFIEKAKPEDLLKLYQAVDDTDFRAYAFETLISTDNLRSLSILAHVTKGEQHDQVVTKIRGLVAKNEHIVQFLAGDFDMIPPMYRPYMCGPHGMYGG